MPATRTRYPQYINPAKLMSSQKYLSSTPSIFGADNRTCSERRERNSISEAILLPSGASAACRGKQTQCRLPTKRSFVSSPLSHEKRQPFRIVFFACVRQNLVFREIFESVSNDKYFFNVSSSFLKYIFCFRDFRIRIQNHVLNDEFLYCGY